MLKYSFSNILQTHSLEEEEKKKGKDVVWPMKQ
jgi:hypothetical protein